MVNILSYQQPLKGRVIKDWITHHSKNETEYSRIAKRMIRYLDIADNELYQIVLRPEDTAGGKRKRYNPIVVRHRTLTASV